MKLKYYMRGLGIGIILTTLIFIISNPKEKLTDQEVITRAQGLGMVMGQTGNPDLKDVLQGLNPTEGAVSTTPAPDTTGQPSATPAGTPTQAPTTAPTQAPTAAPTIVPTPEPTIKPVIPTIKPTDIPIPTKVPVTDNASDESKGITFTIERGMSSGKVAALLVQVGLVKNADEFNQYVEAEGKASIIRVGTYTLPKGSTYEEIVLKITTK